MASKHETETTETETAEPAASESVPDAKPDAKPDHADKLAALREAMSFAQSEADLETGTLTQPGIERVLDAYRAIPTGKRGEYVASAVAEVTSSAYAMDAATRGHTGPIRSVGLLAAKVAEAAAAGATRATVQRDPLEIAAERVALLNASMEHVRAGVEADKWDEVVERAQKVESTDGMVARLARVVNALGGTRKPRSGDGTRRDLPPLILAALQSDAFNAGEPITYSAIAKVIDASGGAVQNSLHPDKGNYSGISVTKWTDDGNVAEVTISDKAELALASDTSDDDDDK